MSHTCVVSVSGSWPTLANAVQDSGPEWPGAMWEDDGIDDAFVIDVTDGAALGGNLLTDGCTLIRVSGTQDGWQLEIRCEAQSGPSLCYWYGQRTSIPPGNTDPANDPSGTYTRSGGSSSAPSTVTIGDYA